MPRLDNRQVENLSEKCRPSNVAVAYNSLESQQWIEAKESLEDNTEYEEEIILRILCSILVVSSTVVFSVNKIKSRLTES